MIDTGGLTHLYMYIGMQACAGILGFCFGARLEEEQLGGGVYVGQLGLTFKILALEHDFSPFPFIYYYLSLTFS